MTNKEAQEPQLTKLGQLNFWLIVITALTTAFYAAFCLWRVWGCK